MARRWQPVACRSNNDLGSNHALGQPRGVAGFGIVADGTLAESMRVLIAKTVVLSLSLAAYAGDRLASASSASRRA
jgi:hypothetical protein